MYCSEIRRKSTRVSSGKREPEHDEAHAQGYIYQPVGFDPSEHPGPIADHPDAARWLLNTIYFRRVVRNYDRDEFVNLHSKLLGMVMGDINHVKPIREAMERRGLIESDHEWILDRKSLGYRLGPLLSGADWCRYSSPNKRFLKRVEKFKSWARQTTGFNHPAHHHLAAWAWRVRLDDDLGPVFAEIRAREDDAHLKRISKEELARHQADLIHRGYIHLTVCPYGRFHSNFSGLCRELRPRLSIDGQRLVEVDVVNSQPYFLGLLLLEVALSGRNCPNLSRLLFSASEDHSLFLSKIPQKEKRKRRENGQYHIFLV